MIPILNISSIDNNIKSNRNETTTQLIITDSSAFDSCVISAEYLSLTIRTLNIKY